MSDLTGKLIANTYKDLLQIASSASNGGLDSTLRSVQDGSGNNSSLKISETSAAFTGNVSIAGSLNIGNAFTVGSIETALISATTIRGSTVSVTNITTDTLTAETLTFQDVSVSSLRTGSLTVTNTATVSVVKTGIVSVTGNSGRSLDIITTDGGSSDNYLSFYKDSASPSTFDEVQFNMDLNNDAGTRIRYSSIETKGYDIVAGSESSQIRFRALDSGATATWFQYLPTNFYAISLRSNTSVGGDLNVTGSLTVTNNVTATAYYGDGSNLTGIASDTRIAAVSALTVVNQTSIAANTSLIIINQTSIAANASAVVALSATLETRIAAVSALTAVNKTSIAANASAVVALSATLETRIAAVSVLTTTNKTSIAANASAVVALSATLETRIAAVSVLTATNKTSIAANASAVVALSATLETRIAAVSVLTATNKTSITANASTVVALSATLESRIAALSATVATSISNYLPLTGGSLTGVVTITTGDNNPQLVLKSIDSDNLSGPLIELFRDSISPTSGDETGRISFQAKDSLGNKVEYSRINSYIDNVTAASATGWFEIDTNGLSRIMFDETEAVINNNGIDYDFRVESDTVANALFVQGSSGNVGINNALPNTALDVTGNITVSGGIYIGGTGAANLLDDYEEGTYTVQLFDASSGGNASSSSRTGTYTKIGNLVTCKFASLNNISTAGMTGTNDLYFSLPFAAGSTGRSAGSVIFDTLTFVSGRTMVTPLVLDSSSRGQFRTSGSAVTDLVSEVQDINNGTTDINTFTLTYETA